METTNTLNSLPYPPIYRRQCQYLSPENSTACNESMSLTEVIGELNQLYRQQIEMLTDNSPQHLHRKCQLLSRWCEELLQQTTSLIDCITTLEEESCRRLAILNTHHNGINRIRLLDNDLQNLIELIVRKQRTNCWDTTKLMFYDRRVRPILAWIKDHKNGSLNIEIMTGGCCGATQHQRTVANADNQCCCNETISIKTNDSNELSL